MDAQQRTPGKHFKRLYLFRLWSFKTNLRSRWNTGNPYHSELWKKVSLMTKPLFLFLFLFMNLVYAQESGFQKIKTFEEYLAILERSNQGDKMVLISLVDDNLEDGVKTSKQNSSDSLIFQLKNFSKIEFDVKSAIGAQWIQTFPVDILPAYFFLTKDEILLFEIQGFVECKALVEKGKEVVTKKLTYPTLNAKYAKGSLTIDEWLELIRIHRLNFNFQQSTRICLEFLNGLSSSELLDPKIAPILETFGISLETKYPNFILDNLDKLIANGNFNYSIWFDKSYSFNLERAIFNLDSVYLEKVIYPLIEKSKDEDKISLIYSTRQLYIEETSQVELTYKAVLDWTEDMNDSIVRSRYIFDEAFKLADLNADSSTYKTAQRLAKKANSFHEDFRYLMLESYCEYKLKSYNNAKVLASRAKAISKSVKDEEKAASLLRMIEIKLIP